MKTYSVCLGKSPQLDGLRTEAAVAGKWGGGESQEATQVVVIPCKCNSVNQTGKSCKYQAGDSQVISRPGKKKCSFCCLSQLNILKSFPLRLKVLKGKSEVVALGRRCTIQPRHGNRKTVRMKAKNRFPLGKENRYSLYLKEEPQLTWDNSWQRNSLRRECVRRCKSHGRSA